MPGNEVEILVTAESAKKASRDIQGLNKPLRDVAQTARNAGLALAAFGVAGAFAAKTFVDAAFEQRRAMATLANAVRQTGTDFETLRGQVERTTAALQDKTNFGDEEQIRALARMTTILGSTEKALAALPLALDAAAISGSSLFTVAGTLSRALGGQANVAESLGVTFEATANFTERLTAGLEAAGGAAEADVTPMSQLSNAVGNLKEAIGEGLIPVVIPLVENLLKLTKGLTEFSKAHPALIANVSKLIIPVTAIGVALLTFGLIIGPLTAGVHALAAAMTVLKTAQIGTIATQITSIGAAALITAGSIGLLIGAIVAFPALVKVAAASLGDDANLLGPKAGDLFRAGERNLIVLFRAEIKDTIQETAKQFNVLDGVMDDFASTAKDINKVVRNLTDGLGGGGGAGGGLTPALASVTTGIQAVIDVTNEGTDATENFAIALGRLDTVAGRAFRRTAAESERSRRMPGINLNVDPAAAAVAAARRASAFSREDELGPLFGIGPDLSGAIVDEIIPPLRRFFTVQEAENLVIAEGVRRRNEAERQLTNTLVAASGRIDGLFGGLALTIPLQGNIQQGPRINTFEDPNTPFASGNQQRRELEHARQHGHAGRRHRIGEAHGELDTQAPAQNATPININLFVDGEQITAVVDRNQGRMAARQR